MTAQDNWEEEFDKQFTETDSDTENVGTQYQKELTWLNLKDELTPDEIKVFIRSLLSRQREAIEEENLAVVSKFLSGVMPDTSSLEQVTMAKMAMSGHIENKRVEYVQGLLDKIVFLRNALSHQKAQIREEIEGKKYPDDGSTSNAGYDAAVDEILALPSLQ